MGKTRKKLTIIISNFRQFIIPNFEYMKYKYFKKNYSVKRCKVKTILCNLYVLNIFHCLLTEKYFSLIVYIEII